MLKAPTGQPRGVGTGHPVCTAGASSLGAGAGRQTKRSMRTEAGGAGRASKAGWRAAAATWEDGERAGGRKPSGATALPGERRAKARTASHSQHGTSAPVVVEAAVSSKPHL